MPNAANQKPIKEWFKYGKGFVNMDDHNLYFNHSGNWQDTLNLEEKNRRTTFKTKKRGVKTFLFIAFGFIILGLTTFTINRIIDGKITLGLAFGLFLIFFKINSALDGSTGVVYRIPYPKINKIHIDKNWVYLEFLNKEGQLDSEQLANVDHKGIQLLTQLIRDKNIEDIN